MTFRALIFVAASSWSSWVLAADEPPSFERLERCTYLGAVVASAYEKASSQARIERSFEMLEKLRQSEPKRASSKEDLFVVWSMLGLMDVLDTLNQMEDSFRETSQYRYLQAGRATAICLNRSEGAE